MIQLRTSLALLFVSAAVLSFVIAPQAAQTEALPLELEAKIPLGDVNGRIDHLAFDPKRHRLFVAELGNGSVGVVDLDNRKVIHVISGLKEPQGVAYVPSSDTLYVASGGDGSVRVFQAADYAAAARIDLGDDADNVRVDAAANRVFVGYGSGALAVIDPARPGKIAESHCAPILRASSLRLLSIAPSSTSRGRARSQLSILPPVRRSRRGP